MEKPWFKNKLTRTESVTPILVEAIEVKEKLPPKLGEAKKSKENETNTKLSKLAGVGKETYRMGAKILNSDNEKLKQEVLSGEKSINAGYKELTGKKENQYI